MRDQNMVKLQPCSATVIKCRGRCYAVGLIVSLALLFPGVACRTKRVGQNGGSSTFSLTKTDAIIVSKWLPSLYLLNSQHQEMSTVFSSEASKKLSSAIYARYKTAIQNCSTSRCLVEAFVIDRDEQKLMSELYARSPRTKRKQGPVKRDVGIKSDDAMKADGVLKSDHAIKAGQDTKADKNMKAEAGMKADNVVITDESLKIDGAIKAMNYSIETYLGNKPPRYPKVDAMSFLPTDKAYLQRVKEAVSDILNLPRAREVYYGLPMLTALKLLELNGRDEAARYEPLTSGINSEAYKNVSRVKWSVYPYSAILVPGLGPQVAGVALDPGGARRCALAAERFRKGDAPFIIVSGGHVHPNKTPFSEAVEMRKYLIENLKIPASAIICEPHARHTTTNIRNAARIIYRFGIPPQKQVLLVTDMIQSAYVLMLKGRFIEELGYLPHKGMGRVGNGATWFLPDSSALRANPLDPLDP